MSYLDVLTTAYLALVGFAFYKFATAGGERDLVMPSRALHVSGLVLLLCTGLLILVGVTADANEESIVGPGALAGWVLGFVGMLVSIGVLASRLNRSPILWIGIAILFFPLGTAIAYFLQWRSAKRVLEKRALNAAARQNAEAMSDKRQGH